MVLSIAEQKIGTGEKIEETTVMALSAWTRIEISVIIGVWLDQVGDPENETYRGVAPFSEPETQAIRELVSTHDFSSSISYHSYSQLVLYPWGYTWDAPPHEDQLSEMAEDMANAIKEVYGQNYTAEQASDIYITSGGSDDWLYGSYNIAAFTIELRPEDWQDNVDNPFVLSEDQIIPTWEENIPAALYLIELSQQL
jgi:carboxypeptidase T